MNNQMDVCKCGIAKIDCEYHKDNNFMKDYFKIEEDEYGTKYYFNENNEHHRLAGPAVEWKSGSKGYYINNICYIRFYKHNNELYIFRKILKLISEYEQYIKQNIQYLLNKYNPKIKFHYFNEEEINEFPHWLQTLIK